MQKQLLAGVLPLLLVLLAAGDAQTPAPGGPAALQKVDVIRDTDGISVEMTGRGHLTPKVTTLASPDRIVVALPDTVAATSSNHLSLDSPPVKSIRIGMDGQTPPTTKVVIDCASACGYELAAADGNKVVVKLRASASGSAATPGSSAPPQAQESKPSEPVQSMSAAHAPPEYPQKTAAVGKYNGPGGCAASSCHGSVQPKTTTRIYQNEYTIWIARDLHAGAFRVLRNPVSQRIGRILNIGPPDQAQKCLVCHSLSVPPDQRAQTFELDDGVSCENCHGPASGWLGPHTTKDWPYEKSVQLGMYDTRNLAKRTEKCLTCHLGTAEKFVDHEMIAAGHPDLTFELGEFTFAMPAHWKMPEQNNPWRSVQAWGVGQAVNLRESLNRLARRANGTVWPEYAELDCFACHHSLTAPSDSWRQERGYPGRRPGNSPWNQARVVVFRDLANAINPEAERQLAEELTRLAGVMNQLNGNREQIAASATRASTLADQLARHVEAQNYDQALTLRLLRRISQDGAAIAAEGERSAEQGAMTMDTLFRAYDQNSKPANSGEIRTAIDGLFQQLQQNPSGYSAPRFAAQMQRVSDVLGR